MKFQGLFNDKGAIAMSIRLISNNRGFDIKTSFNESRRALYPGVTLEICNMQDLEKYPL